jgi:hypothetical protein
VGIEHGDKRVEVSIARGGEEGFDDFFLLCGRVGVVGGRVRTADAAASAAGELARRLGERSRMAPISSKGTENMSWRT